MNECKNLGYEPVFLTDCLNIEARAAGAMLSNIAYSHSMVNKKLAFIAGGETIVYLSGRGKEDGTRNLLWGLLLVFRVCGMWLYLVWVQMERMDLRMQRVVTWTAKQRLQQPQRDLA